MIRTSEFELLPESVMSAEQMEARRSCCQSGCINCLSGFTLKRHGLLFKKIDYDEIKTINEYFNIDIGVNYKTYELVVLKGFLIGIMQVDKIFVTKLILHPLVSPRVISKEIVESYYFN